MIPVDHVSFNDDGTAWWVFDENGPAPKFQSDRPCETCKGTGAGKNRHKCSDCHGTGRHTFTIEVEGGWASGIDGLRIAKKPLTYRVSVIPGMVLPIVDGPWVPPDCIRRPDMGDRWVVPGTPSHDPYEVTLPSAAAPGMWAVKLKVGP